MTWLMSLPAAVLVVGGIALALLVAIGGRLAVRALVPTAEREAAYTIASPLMSALGALFALLMGLILASEAVLLVTAQGIVSNEAADASRLAWRRPAPESTRRRSSHPCSATCERRGPMNGTATARPKRTIPPPLTPSPAWKMPSGPRRPARPSGHPRAPSCWPPSMLSPTIVAPAWPRPHVSFPPFYVAVLLLTGTALIVNANTLTLRSGWRSALLVGGLAAVIGLSLALLFALGTPWRGAITVSGQPIDAVVHDLNK